MHETTFEEPSCQHGWCGTQWSKKWSGPGQEGYWIAPTGERIPFDPKPVKCEDLEERCAEWVLWESDECTKNPKFMLKKCRKSCGACGEPSHGHDEL